MIVHKYIASDMPEAILKIRKELGKDAVILDTKKVFEKKFWGLKRIPRLEVTAASGQDAPEVQSRLSSVKQPEGNSIDGQLSEIRNMLHTVLQTNDRMMGSLSDYLREQGFTKEQATNLVQESCASTTDSYEMKDVLQGCLMERLTTQNCIQPISSSSRIVSFVGPTGVGKTTTIAKLAAMHMGGNKKIGLVTTDTFRIAAIEQLKTYAKILDVPIEVAYSPEDLKDAIEKLKDRDLIFIDTAGRNFRMESYVEETTAFLSGIPVDETLLVLSLTMKTKDLNDIVDMFINLPIDKFVFTKFDETDSYGSILNILMTHTKPMSYITTGQNVPDDIEIPSLDKIVTMVLEGVQ